MKLADAAAHAVATLSASRNSAPPTHHVIEPLVRIVAESSAPEVAATKLLLKAALRLALLCGHKGVVRRAYLVIEAASQRGDAEGDAVVIDLLPLLLDQAASFGATGGLAQACALTALALLPRAAAAAITLHTGPRPQIAGAALHSVAARRRRAETVLLVLSRQSRSDAEALDSKVRIWQEFHTTFPTPEYRRALVGRVI